MRRLVEEDAASTAAPHAYRTPAYRNQALRRELTRRAVPFSDEVRVPHLPLGSWSPIELRPYQEAALWAWELAQRRAVVVLPTGSGKTRLALAAMARAGSSALCLVPTRILLAQWLHHNDSKLEERFARDFRRVAPGLGRHPRARGGAGRRHPDLPGP